MTARTTALIVTMAFTLAGCCCGDCLPSNIPDDSPYHGYWVGEDGTTLDLFSGGSFASVAHDDKSLSTASAVIADDRIRLYTACGVDEMIRSVSFPKNDCFRLDGEKMTRGALLPPGRLDLVGRWKGAGITLTIRADGFGRFEQGGVVISGAVTIVGKTSLTITVALCGESESIRASWDGEELKIAGTALKRVEELPATSVHDDNHPSRTGDGGGGIGWD